MSGFDSKGRYYPVSMRVKILRVFSAWYVEPNMRFIGWALTHLTRQKVTVILDYKP
jgi:hypothetical protein